jgi:hypothetical protein
MSILNLGSTEDAELRTLLEVEESADWVDVCELALNKKATRTLGGYKLDGEPVYGRMGVAYSVIPTAKGVIAAWLVQVVDTERLPQRSRGRIVVSMINIDQVDQNLGTKNETPATHQLNVFAQRCGQTQYLTGAQIRLVDDNAAIRVLFHMMRALLLGDIDVDPETTSVHLYDLQHVFMHTLITESKRKELPC